MTTRITVTTGDGGLVERNAQQQAANRQGAVVRNSANKATAAGTERRRLDRIATGRNPETGDPLIPPPSATTLARLGSASTPGIPRLNQQIGASRLGGAALDPLVIDFSTAGNAVQYSQTNPGSTTTIRKLNGSVKYKRVASPSQYAANNGEDSNTLETQNGAGPFGQSVIRTFGPNFFSRARIEVSYPPEYVSGWEPLPGVDPNRPDFIVDPPPYQPASFNTNFRTPHTLEADIYYDTGYIDCTISATLRFALIQNAALSSEILLKDTLISQPFSPNRSTAPPCYFFIRTTRNYSTVFLAQNSIGVTIGGKTLDGGESLFVSEAISVPSYIPGWNRLAVSAGASGVRVFENTINHIGLTDNLKNYTAQFPVNLEGHTWIAELRVEYITDGERNLIALSSMRHARKEIKGAYIPSKLS